MVSDAQRVARFIVTRRVYGAAAFNDENKRATFDFNPGEQEKAYRDAVRYLEDGLGSSAEDLGGIQLVSVSVLPRTRRRTWEELSPSQAKRYAGSRQAQNEARQHGVSVERWYEIAPDLKSFRGHAPERPVKAVYLGIAYVTYIDQVTPTGKAAPDKSAQELSAGVRQAYRRRKANERRREAYAARKAQR